MKEMMNKDEQFERNVKASLDANVDAIEGDTRERLAEIRLQTLKAQALNAQTNNKSPFFGRLNINRWLPASALAFASLFAVFLVFSPQNLETSPVQNDQVAVYELLNNTDELDAMIDPDFYAWIDESLDENLDKNVDVAS